MSVTVIILIALTYNLAFLHTQSEIGIVTMVIVDFRNTSVPSCPT
jgi:hypothetical protein